MKAKRLPWVLALALASPVWAQSNATNPQFKSAPPPPGLNDPGVTATAPAATTSSAKPQTTPAELTPTRLPGRPIPLPAEPKVPGAKQSASTPATTDVPDVDVHQEGDNTVQVYRRGGKAYMVVVTPKNGLAQTYMVGGDGRLTPSDGGPKVAPAMYNVLEWGKSKPAEDDDDGSTDGASQSGH